MLVIPFKTTKNVDIAKPLLSWIIHKEKQSQTHPIPQSSSPHLKPPPDGDHHDLLSESNISSDKSSAIIRKTSNDGVNGAASILSSRVASVLVEDPNGPKPKNPHALPVTYPSSQEAEEGLLRLSALRRSLSLTISSRERNSEIDLNEKFLNTAMEYHASLLECENRGFPTNDDETDLHLEWYCAFEEDREPIVRSSLHFEQAAILFNTGALESYLASEEDTSTRRGLTSAVHRYNMAASIFAHIRTEVLPKLTSNSSDNNSNLGLTLDLTPPCLKMCESMLLAQGQACMYEMARFRPMHNVLAKISMGAAEIYGEALFSSQDRIVRAKMTEVEKWGAHFKAMSMLFRARAEYHESICARETANKQGKPGHGLEIARLTMAESLCEQAIIFGNKRLVDLKVIADLKRAVLERKNQAEEENDKIHQEKIPYAREVEPTRGQRMSKIVALKKNLTTLSVPLFRKEPLSHAKSMVERYKAESNDILHRCTNLVQRETDAARNTLAKANLPQGLTSYSASKQGIPLQTWQKVEACQHADEIERLKDGLWGLRELSDIVHKTANDINEQLDEDVKLDTDFRKKYPGFNGHDVMEVQHSTRRNMEQCGKLLANAKSGDKILLQYLQKFDSDPKFKLLQYSKQQLDNLTTSSFKGSIVDTEPLSRDLVNLSSLIHEREHLLKYLKQQYDNFDVQAHADSLQANDSPENAKLLKKLIEEKSVSFKSIQLEINNNIEKQPGLLYSVLNENEKFVQAQASSNSNSAGQNFVPMIEEGLSTIKIVSKQLEDGRNFYTMIVPRLNQLKQHVSFMSVRLAVQRFDHEDNTRAHDERLKQEIEDEKVAKTLSLRNTTDSTANSTISRPQTYGDDELDTDAPSGSFNPTAATFSLPPSSQHPVRVDASNSISRLPHQQGSDSLHARLLEPPSSRSSSVSGAMMRPPPASHLSPSNVSASMSNFGRNSGRNDDSPYEPPSYSQQPPTAGQPGIYFQSHFKPPPTIVDDEKVARLVAMEFDPEKVVLSLQKYDNNFDRALNDLLQC